MYNDIKLEKGLYSITGKSFTEALSELDPDSQYKGTELEGLDAFERQLRRFNIKVAGCGSDPVESFFINTESAVLFPEYVRRQIKAGMEEASILSTVAAARTYTDSYDFRALSVDGGESAATEQLNALPKTTVKLASSASALEKYGRTLECSYESIRKQRLEAFGVILRSVGAQLARDIDSACVKALKTAAGEVAYSADITYAVLADFWSKMNEYDMDVMLCTPAVMAKILALDEMKYCVTDFMSSGKVVTPYGVTLVKCSAVDEDTVIGIDSSCAAEVVFGSDVLVDFDKLISTQAEEISVSVLCGFSALTAGAIKKLSKSGG